MIKARAIELRQLRHFVEIVRCSSFGRAAEKLHLTQPALSKSIRNLEQTLEVRLMERHGHGIEPTPYGEVLFEYASFMLSELERAVEEIDHMRGRGEGLIRVGAGTSLLQYFLPETVKRFVADGEAETVQMRQGLRDALLPLLRRGEIDLVVGSVNPEACPDDLIQEVILEDRLAIVAAANHKLVGKPDVRLEDLVDYQWVIPDTSEPEGDRLVRAFKKAGLPKPQTVVRTGSSVFMASLLRDSEYLSYLPRALISEESRYGHLRALNAPDIWESVHVGVTFRKKSVMLPATRRFISTLKRVGASLAEASEPA
ncbi:MAG: LysR family transcriptional regulator [Oceanicaulis sp.]